MTPSPSSSSGPDKDGRISFDVAGHLAGNWFVEGQVPLGSGEAAAYGSKVLSFARDVQDQSILVVSVGGSLSLTARPYAFADGAPDPVNVSPATGIVAYRLYGIFPESVRTGTGIGVLLVQMTSDSRIRVEGFPVGSTPNTFTPVALNYER